MADSKPDLRLLELGDDWLLLIERIGPGEYGKAWMEYVQGWDSYDPDQISADPDQSR